MEENNLSLSSSYQLAYDAETGNWRCITYPNTYATGEIEIEVSSTFKLEE